MAAIGRRIALLLLFFTASLFGVDPSVEARAQIGQIATALTTGNAADAIAPFDKSYADYEKLKRYFQGLNAFQVDNEIDVTDEQDSETDITLSVNWTLTLTDLSSGANQRHTADIKVRLRLKDKKWKIVEFSPIDIFDPQKH